MTSALFFFIFIFMNMNSLVEIFQRVRMYITNVDDDDSNEIIHDEAKFCAVFISLCLLVEQAMFVSHVMMNELIF